MTCSLKSPCHPAVNAGFYRSTSVATYQFRDECRNVCIIHTSPQC